MAAGSIVLDLIMRTGAFETDTKRAEKALTKFQKEAERVGKVVGASIAAGLTGAAYAFDSLVKQVGDFQDFAEVIGDSAENVASLAIAAATAGVSMDAVTGATVKLTKGLTGVDDESKATGAALKAMGIDLQAFKQLDPVAQFEAVGRAMAGFADGASKTAVAVALYGKSGAEMLKVFKALEEQGGRTAILTQKQIELADQYSDTQAKAVATLKTYAQVAATEFLPALNDLTNAAIALTRELLGVDAAGKTMAGGTAIKDFADGIGTAIAFAVDQVDLFVRLFQIAGKALGGLGAVIVLTMQGHFSQAVDAAKAAAEDIDAVMSKATFGDKYRTQRAARNAADANPADYSNEGRLATKVPLMYEGAVKKPKEKKDKTTDADRYIESLDKQLQKTKELTAVETVLDDIARGRFKETLKSTALMALTKAQEIDINKQLASQREADTEVMKRENDLFREAAQDREALFTATRTPAEAYALELKRINVLFENGARESELYQRVIAQLGERFDENAQRIKAIAQEINASVEGNFADAFAGFIDGSLSAKDAFSQFAKSVIADMSRMASQQLAKQLFGGDAQGKGGIGSWITGLAGLFGGMGGGSNTGSYNTSGALELARAEGGPVSAGGSYMVGERGPERFVPSTAGRIVPNEALSGRGDIQVVTPPGMPLTVQKLEERQSDGRMLEKLILSTVARDARQGGPAIQATAGVLGARRSLPRRGR